MLFNYRNRIIEKIYSPTNGWIIVEKVKENIQIKVQGYIQSGKYIENLLDKTFGCLHIQAEAVKRILFLGFGPGSSLRILKQYFPDSEITGIDKDQIMFDLGVKYFSVKADDKLHLITDDASDFVYNYKGRKFDMVLTDIFTGCDSPESAGTENFIKNIHNILKVKGIFVSNKSYLNRYKKVTDLFIERVKKRFDSVRLIHLQPNAIVIGIKK